MFTSQYWTRWDSSLAVVHSQDCITNREKVGKASNLQYGTFQQFYGLVILFGRRLVPSHHSKSSLHLNWIVGTAVVRLQLAWIWVILTLAIQPQGHFPTPTLLKFSWFPNIKSNGEGVGYPQSSNCHSNTTMSAVCRANVTSWASLWGVSVLTFFFSLSLSLPPSCNTLKRQELSSGLEEVEDASAAPSALLLYCMKIFLEVPSKYETSCS